MKQLNLWLLLFVSLSYSCSNVSVDKKNTEQTIPPNIIYKCIVWIRLASD